MQTPDPSYVAHSILTAPAWARLGITMADPRMRERAAEELALAIVERLDQPPAIYDASQIPLPL
ncbi:MAG TPA: DUF6771 family protein [Sphingomonas sp.]|uniref:DUF6771 family protein n=1 Tax=Sphingomonas sp. TaxID=28214 RepID=UPI002EDA0023